MKRKQKKYGIKRGQLFSGISQANHKYKYVIVFDLGQIKRSTVTKKKEQEIKDMANMFVVVFIQ